MTRFEQLYGIPLAKRRRTEILIALMALEIIFAFSYLGFIIIPPISITTMHLLVMIAAMILGTRESVAVSLVFALTSMWQAGVSGVQYSDLIFSPIQSGEPLNSLLLNSARLIGGFAAGELFKLCFARKRKHVYLCIALTTLAATWIFGTLTYLFMALLFPQTGVTVSMALMAWIEPSNLAVYVLTVLAMMLVHFALSQNGVKRYMTAVAGLEGHFKSKGLHAYYGMIVAATALCVTVMMHLIDRLKIVLGQKGYTAAFAIRSRESQILFQFFCAFSGILLLLYVTVRWIGEYHAAKSISLQKQTDALEKLKAEQILSRKLQEQNAMLESQQQQLREAAARAEAAQRESQRLADEARAANAAKTNFLARVTHDIRTPLNGIFGLLKINEMHSDDVELLRSNHEKMMVSAKHLLSLINDMLQMSKLEDGEYVLSREWVDLNELLRDVLTIVSQRAAEVGVTMTYDRNADWVVYPYIYASPLHVRQLFLNIYGNCIKYNHVGGRVDTVLDCMGVENGKVTYRWTISDTGVGMSEDFLQHIFEPFAQENSDARSVYQGTGLGMAIAKSLADKMGGDIRVTSEKGKGSVFVVTLAFEIAEEKRGEETSAAADIAGLRLLLAEDNELNAEIAERLLSDEGARIAVVRDGQKAVETFRDQPPGTFDAILMDVMMPVMDGLSATRAIREMDRPDAKTIPIIAMTASAFEEDAQRCMKAGMNAHIPKPLQMERVLTTIAKCCRH